MHGMEEVCQDLGLSYGQCVEGGCGGSPVLIDTRPGMTEPLYRTGRELESDETLVDEAAVREAMTALEAGRADKATSALRRLCPDVPDVPPFTIV